LIFKNAYYKQASPRMITPGNTPLKYLPQYLKRGGERSGSLNDAPLRN